MVPCIPVMSMISHEISWWDISVVQVIQVIQVVQVNQPIQVMQVRLAHLWPDCRVIYCEILSKKSYQSYPRIPGGSNNGGGRCATAAAASTIGDHFDILSSYKSSNGLSKITVFSSSPKRTSSELFQEALPPLPVTGKEGWIWHASSFGLKS